MLVLRRIQHPASHIPITLLRFNSSSPIRNTKSTVLSTHSMTTMEFLNTHRFPIHRRILQFWQLYKHSDTITSCFCGLKPCVCDIVTSKSLRHSFKDSHRPSTQIQHPHISPPMIVSLSVAISINTMTPILETPSCASTNIQPDTNNFKEHH